LAHLWIKCIFAVSFVQVKENRADHLGMLNSIADNAHLLSQEKFSEYWKDKLDTEMRARMFSAATKRSYLYYNRMMCKELQKTPEEISISIRKGRDDASRFLARLEKEKKYAASTVNLCISAIKFFYFNVMKTRKINEQPRPRKDSNLPVVLSKEEIGKLIKTEDNPKHRILLMLVYSSGVRVSEAVILKREDIDFNRKTIHVRQGKGRKDRYVRLADKLDSELVHYYALCNIQTWLFPGQRQEQHIKTRTAQHIFAKALHRAEINKKISIHGLRHTYATHLLEDGADICSIRDLLGHASIRTTELYTHVARRSVLKIKSPLDSIM
jgi:site-specific recombinase XerD